MSAAKPTSLPKLAAAKPPSLRKLARAEPPVIASASRSDPHGAVTAQMPVAALPAAAVPSEPPPAVPSAKNPSSFPSSGKVLVFEVTGEDRPTLDDVATSTPPLVLELATPSTTSHDHERFTPPPPSSVGGIVITPAHERLAASSDEPALLGAPADDSRTNDTVEIFPKRRWRILPLLVAVGVGGVAALVLGGRFVRRTEEPFDQNARPARGAMPAAPARAVVTAPPSTARPPTPAPPAPSAPATTGRLSTASAAPGRRIFVDERTVGETPTAVVVSCGSHRVRIGSRGKTTIVDVPCGGEIAVLDR